MSNKDALLDFWHCFDTVLTLFDITEWEIPGVRDLADRSPDKIASLNWFYLPLPAPSASLAVTLMILT